MGTGWFIEIGLLILTIYLVMTTQTETDRIDPSDIICSTYANCMVGDVEFHVGDAVSSPKYSFGFRIGEIILMNPDNKTATIKWANGQTTTESLTDLNKLKKVTD